MPTWLLFSLASPVFWSISNIIDKISVEKISTSPSQFIFLLSQFYLIIFIIYLWAIHYSSFNIFAISSGIMLFFLYYLYAIPLEKEDVSAVILIHQAEPVFVLVLVAAISQAIPTARELAGFLLIICGLLWFLRPGKDRQERAAISARSAAMLLLSAFVGAGATIASDIALDNLSLIDLLGQSACGYGVTGAVMLLFSPNYRNRAFTAGEAGIARKAALIGLTGLFDLAGYACFYAALARSPNAGLVAAVTSIHPIFLVVISGTMACWFPRLFQEDNSGSRLARKIVASMVVVGGVILLG